MEHKRLNFMAMRIMVLKGKRSLRHLARASEDPMRENTMLLRKILRQNRNTEFGRLHHFGAIRHRTDVCAECAAYLRFHGNAFADDPLFDVVVPPLR